MPGTASAFRDLYGLRSVDDLDLARYVAGDPGDARHVMRLARGNKRVTRRTLIRGEAEQWAAGLAAGAGHVDLGDRVANTPVPELVTLAEAADMLGLTERGVDHVIGRGRLYPLYGNTSAGTSQARYLFACQVRAEARSRGLADENLQPRRRRVLELQLEDATAAWQLVRAMLPTPVPIAMAEGDIQPGPSPDPLPLDPRIDPATLAVQGLQLAERRGWLTYHYPLAGVYAVTMANLDGAQVDMTVPAKGLLAWLLGVADFHRRADLVAYRPGLGG